MPFRRLARATRAEYRASASFPGGLNYFGSQDSQDFVIARATATITVGGYVGTYDGAAHGARGLGRRRPAERT